MYKHKEVFLKDLSIVIPVCNEEGNIISLHEEIVEALSYEKINYEIIFVNDGSNDDTALKINDIVKNFSNVSLKTLKYNMGQGIALFEGIKSSNFNYICVLDGDRQFFPADIKKLMELMEIKKLDFICGKRTQRSDDVFLKILPSILGNKFISLIFGTHFEDIGCSLKIFQKKHVLKLKPFKNIHRYLNLLLLEQGLSYEEIAVYHRQRVFGKTKYTMFKFWGVIIEVIWLRVFYIGQMNLYSELSKTSTQEE